MNPEVAQAVERHVEAVEAGVRFSASGPLRRCPCGVVIANRTVVAGKVINTQRRKFCFTCSPFGNGNGQKVGRPARGRKRIAKAVKQEDQRRLRRERKRRLIEMFGGKCSKCGYSKCFRALEFHHRDRKGKEFNLSVLGYTCRWARLVKEAAKCDLTCANCHRELEEERSEN